MSLESCATRGDGSRLESRLAGSGRTPFSPRGEEVSVGMIHDGSEISAARRIVTRMALEPLKRLVEPEVVLF